MQSGAGTFSHGVKTFDGRLSVQVDKDTSAEIVGGRGYRDIIFSDVDAQAKTFLVNIGEMFLCFFGIFVGNIQIYMVVSTILHLVVDGTCHDVTGSQGKTGIVFLHELFAIHGAQYASVAAHRFRYQERRTISRVIQGGRVELYKLHILHRTFGTINHSDTVSGSD